MIKLLWEKNSQLAATLPFVFISSDSWAIHSRKLRLLLGRTLYGLGGQHASSTFISGHQRSVHPCWFNISFSALPNTKRKKTNKCDIWRAFLSLHRWKDSAFSNKTKACPLHLLFQVLRKRMDSHVQASCVSLIYNLSPCWHAHTNTCTCMHAQTHTHI